MEVKIKSKNEENLEYIKKYVGYDLAKALFLTIKTDTEDPLTLISKHLQNIASFNEEKKKKKKILKKKLYSYNIKIHDEISKNFTKKKVKDLYEFVNSKGNNLFDDYAEFSKFLNLIKNVFEVENVYVGKIYKKSEKGRGNVKGNGNKKGKGKGNASIILKFIHTSENCDLKETVLFDKKEINNMFTPVLAKKEENFLFETNYLFPNMIKENFIYDDSNENLFPVINPFYESRSSIDRMKKSICSSSYASSSKYDHEGSNISSAQGNSDHEDMKDHYSGSSQVGGDTTGDEEKEWSNEEWRRNDEEANGSDEEWSTNYEEANGSDEERNGSDTEDGKENTSSTNIKERGDHKHLTHSQEKKEIAITNEQEDFEKEQLAMLHMNLTYSCIYIYEIMERQNSFLYSYMKPGDFLFIPIVYYTYYDFHFLRELYAFKKSFFHNFKKGSNTSCEGYSANECNKDGEVKNSESERNNQLTDEENNKESEEIKKNKGLSRPKLDFKKREKVEMCLCLDNRGSIKKINKRHIISLTHLSYFLITRMLIYERKSIKEQVNYMIECEHGEERRLTDKLMDKIGNVNYEQVIKKFENKLEHHYYYDKSPELIKHMSTLLWIEKKIQKRREKIWEIRKIKIECNKNFFLTLLSCYIILEYDFLPSTFSNKAIQDYEWRKLIQYINQSFIDKLTSFNPVLFFQEKGIDKLHETSNLLNKLSSLINKKYPSQMESITTYGITLLKFLNQVTMNILSEVIKVKECEVVNSS
ncbi:conserved Plasmodium protein, unknown function [Plasmodium malariae]|uniref:Uncharacterized protein n=1 Tax=Plasmodium malariae TaxID=5858 RepID=A0A1C3KB29_PLAMA|nr:conserved Plasmodium protein, unknown function [Plasmodium malariae]